MRKSPRLSTFGMVAGLTEGCGWSGGARLWKTCRMAVTESRAQKNGEGGEESSRTKPNLMDSFVPKQCITQTDRQTDR